MRSHLVYKFSCSSCNAAYGKTERHLNVRSGEHIGKSPLTGKKVACKPSAVSDHILFHDNHIIVSLVTLTSYVMTITTLNWH